MFKRFIFYVLTFSCFSCFAAAQSQNMNLIRDQETEDTLRSYVIPMFEVAGLNPDTLKLHLLADNNINAFAVKGSNIFINTGLIMNSPRVGMTLGVLAHETGHIAGGHLVRLYDNMQIAQRNSLISTVLGGVAAIATGRPDVGMAVMMGGSNAAMQGHLSYRRSEENAADEQATKILSKMGYSVKGFVDVMYILQQQEKIAMSQDYYSYLRTHPLSEERISFLENTLRKESVLTDDAHKRAELSYQRIRAKLIAFLSSSPRLVLKAYPQSDMRTASRYARAIAHFRLNELSEALKIMDELLKDNPNDAYFHELKGQMLYENGKVNEALSPYKEAVRLAPDAALIRLSLASVQIESNDKKEVAEGIKNLEKILITEKDNPSVWRLLAVAAGKTEDTALTAYAMAEYTFSMGDYKGAAKHIEKAQKLIPKDSPKYIRLEDIKQEAERSLAKEPQF